METRKPTCDDINATLPMLENDEEKITYICKLLLRYIEVRVIPDKVIWHIEKREMKLLLAKIIRGAVNSQMHLRNVIAELHPDDREQYIDEQEDYWAYGQSHKELLDIAASMHVMSGQGDNAPICHNYFKERLINIEYQGQIPEYMTCPISGEIMNDPITMSSGITYDRSSISAWFAAKSPLTQLPCPATNLPIYKFELDNQPNVSLQALIDDFVKQQEKQAELKRTTDASPSNSHATLFTVVNGQNSSDEAVEVKVERSLLNSAEM